MILIYGGTNHLQNYVFFICNVKLCNVFHNFTTSIFKRLNQFYHFHFYCLLCENVSKLCNYAMWKKYDFIS